MGSLKIILGSLFTLLVIGLLGMYWFMPMEKLEFSPINSGPDHSNFLLNSSIHEEMQFYTNMRYVDSDISYNINKEKCSLQKIEDAERAFDIIENLTVLEFDYVDFGEEISVTCSDEIVFNEDFFIAGEGGPTNITRTDNFNVIFNGKVLLLRNSKCAIPNVAIHEILHALGFEHSENPNNIMYNVTDCEQTIGDDIPKLINEIYSIPPEPDLTFENVSANMQGRYLDANISIRNHGLKNSEKADLIIYADGEKIKEEEIEKLEIGYGITMVFTNILITQLNVEELEFEIRTTFEELEKNNNKIRLQIKK